MNRPAKMHIQSWAGKSAVPCRVVGETPKRYRIEVDQPTGVPPNFSILLPGMTKLVPKRAITFDAPDAP